MKKADIINEVYQLELSKRATLVIFYLINRADSELTCFPGIKTIARECNMSTRTVQRALRDLEEVGIVRKESRFHEQGGQRSNMYYLQEPDDYTNDEIDEVIFEANKEEKVNRETICKLMKVDNNLTTNTCKLKKKEVIERSDFSKIQPIKSYLSWGDSHYDIP